MWKKILGYCVLSVLVIAGGAIGYFWFRQPTSAPPSHLAVEMTPERIARGEYLWRLGTCDACHSQHDVSAHEYRLLAAGRGRGNIFEDGPGIGRVVASNITPDVETGIGTWTDGEKIRAIREGIGRDGRALAPMMPYRSFRYMSDDDVQSLVAFMNTLRPVRHSLPATELKPVMAMLIKGLPRPVKDGSVAQPDRSNRFAYGQYLVTLGNCEICHSPMTGPAIDPARRLSGSHRFEVEKHVVVSANITPHRGTGIGDWTVDYFKGRFIRYRNGVPPDAQGKFTVMPWENLAQLSDDDLEMMYEYLMQQPAIENKVERYPVEVAHK